MRWVIRCHAKESGCLSMLGDNIGACVYFVAAGQTSRVSLWACVVSI